MKIIADIARFFDDTKYRKPMISSKLHRTDRTALHLPKAFPLDHLTRLFCVSCDRAECSPSEE
jgi:hypothetical protein